MDLIWSHSKQTATIYTDLNYQLREHNSLETSSSGITTAQRPQQLRDHKSSKPNSSETTVAQRPTAQRSIDQRAHSSETNRTTKARDPFT
ncbi:hypothetical protein F511_45151 [Dorcoceras hygrometricum]|uniref:Uncharacterized protein n=1 Tax=Dorcoceras hygrometricum TaxID=472368 RepID=A0A2Z6ZWL7_9LAMI|nr:hypothetical protein F511_45151 [Dorcoceras hygrometricum]